jgi:hypothetical protein
MRTHIFVLAVVWGLAATASAGELDREFKGGDVKAKATAPESATKSAIERVAGTELDKESPTQAWRRGGWGWGGGWGRGWGWGGGWGRGWGVGWGRGWGGWGWGRGWGVSVGWGGGWGGWGWGSGWGWPGWGWGGGWGWSPGWGWGTVSVGFPGVVTWW